MSLAMQAMSFGFDKALEFLRVGDKVARTGWNGKGMYIHLQIPTVASKMTLPYIYMKTADNDLVPWVASQSDILGQDWVVIP